MERALSMPAERLDALREETRLLELKGIGRHHGELLALAGIRSVDELARADPDELYETLERERGGRGCPALRREMVRVWIQSARNHGNLTS
jgi:predicted flap endonuclease-1-like 5' DNA nuclease